jgi:hypothetical protein
MDGLALSGGEVDGAALDPFLDVEGRGRVTELGGQRGGSQEGRQGQCEETGQSLHAVGEGGRNGGKFSSRKRESK